VVATVLLVILALSFGAPWITIVALKLIAAELGDLRSVPALATALAWIGFGTGGLVMGYIAERVGVRSTVIFGAVMICIGLALSTGGEAWQLYIGQGLFVGFFGVGGMNAPFYVYISRWFDRRRGSALALISSGSYVAGAVWPPVFERAVAYGGWRQTMPIMVCSRLPWSSRSPRSFCVRRPSCRCRSACSAPCPRPTASWAGRRISSSR
jgi:MFS family permease